MDRGIIYSGAEAESLMGIITVMLSLVSSPPIWPLRVGGVD